MSLQSIRTKRFQSTHPAGGATHTARCRTGKQGISIHAPRGGCDRRRACRATLRNDFNPRTPRGVRLGRCARPPVRIYFNPRTPRGVRLRLRARYRRSHRISIHAPRGGVRRAEQGQRQAEGSISIHAPRGGCDSKTVHFLAHFADIRRKKSHIFRKTKRRFILIGRKCCFLTLFRVRTSREIPVRLHFAAYTRSVSVGK